MANDAATIIRIRVRAFPFVACVIHNKSSTNNLTSRQTKCNYPKLASFSVILSLFVCLSHSLSTFIMLPLARVLLLYSSLISVKGCWEIGASKERNIINIPRWVSRNCCQGSHSTATGVLIFRRLGTCRLKLLNKCLAQKQVMVTNKYHP